MESVTIDALAKTMARVLEVGRDSAFDVGAPGESDLQASESLREKGNAAFQAKDYAAAVSLYTQAIAKHPQNHLLYSNRSAAHYHLKSYAQALADAENTVKLAPTWSKAHVRKAAACEALKKWREALAANEKIVELDDPVETKKAQAKIQQIKRHLQANASGKGPIHKGFFHEPKAKATSGIYAEKEDIVRPVVDAASGTTRLENDDERRWRYMLKRLKGGCNKQGVNSKGEKVVLDDGVFAKLLDQNEFQKLIYPGIPKEQLVHAPKNLQELLEDPWYEEELVSLMPKVQEKAQSVLTNVKKRGAAQGDIMDAATEAMLLPQVFQEAFGREVLAMVHRINYKKHVLLANDARTVADPAADEASWDQLPEEFLDELFSRVPLREKAVAGVAVLDEFLGDDWMPIVKSDAERMVKNGLLLDVATAATTSTGTKCPPSSGSGKMRFLEEGECEKEYPAVAELIEKLHALPFEINGKRPANAALCAQFARCTAIHQLRPGDQQRLRLDCGTGDKDNGFKLSCIYFIGGGSKAEIRLRTELEPDARVHIVRSKRDRLVMFQSQRVLNEIATAQDEDEDLFYVAFWIHGKEIH